jgi:hypothetical protein
MKKTITILINTLLGMGVFAQNPRAKEKIESARIGFITERLGLTPDQAERFWPLYHEYRIRNQDAAVNYRQFRADVDPKVASDDESRRMVELELELKQRRLDLEKEYSKKMLDVISTQQVASLRKAERDFRGILLRRLQDARQHKMRQQRFHDREQFRDRVRDKYRD